MFRSATLRRDVRTIATTAIVALAVVVIAAAIGLANRPGDAEHTQPARATMTDDGS
jgi:hypothetical protein